MNNYLCHYKNTLESTLLRAQHLFVRFGIAILILWVLTSVVAQPVQTKILGRPAKLTT